MATPTPNTKSADAESMKTMAPRMPSSRAMMNGQLGADAGRKPIFVAGSAVASASASAPAAPGAPSFISASESKPAPSLTARI